MMKTLLVVGLGLSTLAFSALAQPRVAGSSGQPAIVQALDANQDGVLDDRELAAASVALRTLDRDGDGQLTAGELSPTDRPPEGRRAGRGSGAAAGGGRGGESGLFSSPQQAKTPFEQRVLDVLADMSANQRRGSMSVPDADGRILRVLTEAIGAKQVVEIGTSIGYSGTWFCLGLQGSGGRLTTYEIDPDRAAQARANFRRAGVDSMVTLVEGDAHEAVTEFEGEIDLLFLDADKEGYVDYLEKLLPRVRAGGLIVAHNMNARQADPAFLKAITTNPALETLFLNLETSGLGLTLKKR